MRFHRPMGGLRCVAAVALALCLNAPASAFVTFDWATVGDPGNAPDTLVMTKGNSIADFTTGYGSVGYTYRIAKHHVTNAQFTEFLNAVDPSGTNALDMYDDRMEAWYHPVSFLPFAAYTGGIDLDESAPAGSRYSVKSGQENYPATWINWETSARFVNWLHNGQLSDPATTNNGVYDMTLLSNALVNPATFPPRQAGAQYFIPSENEFYKAAYYDPTKNGGTGGYWQYGVQSDSPPVSEAPSGGATSANYSTAAGDPGVNGDLYWQNGGAGLNIELNHLTNVGAYTNATSHYGLFDVDGLVYQWTEGLKLLPSTGVLFPAYRGGAWSHSVESNGAAYRALYSWGTADSYAHFGLRIASAVPSLQGDYNDDGSVDAADYVVWRDNLGSTTPLLNSNPLSATPSLVDEEDYTFWVSRFGTGAGLATGVPEPATALSLVVLGAPALRRGRWNRGLPNHSTPTRGGG